jgi:hypothetical protein
MLNNEGSYSLRLHETGTPYRRDLRYNLQFSQNLRNCSSLISEESAS